MMSQSSTSPASLLDLPTELLLIIIRSLDDDGRLNLAGTCERMSLLIIPSLLKVCDFDASISTSGTIGSIFLTGYKLRAVSALGFASFVTSIETIDCNFTAYNTANTPQLILCGVKGLQALARRIPHLGHVRFNPAIRWESHSALQLKLWLFAMAAFLNSASQRGDCTITAYSQPQEKFPEPTPFKHIVPAVPDPWPPKQPACVRLARGLIHILAAPFEPVFRAFGVMYETLRPFRHAYEAFIIFYDTLETANTAEPEELLQPTIQSTERRNPHAIPLVTKPALTTLNIHSSFLFHVHFYRWTLHTLNTSPITTLSLARIDLSHYDWTLTFPALTIQTLTTLAITECEVTVPDLTLFLARHSSIRTLDLSFHIAIGALVPPAAEHLLPRLACLRATPDYLLYFLTRGQECYPDLEDVRITSDDLSAYEGAQFERVVQCLWARRVVPRVEMLGRLKRYCFLPMQ